MSVSTLSPVRPMPVLPVINGGLEASRLYGSVLYVGSWFAYRGTRQVLGVKDGRLVLSGGFSEVRPSSCQAIAVRMPGSHQYVCSYCGQDDLNLGEPECWACQYPIGALWDPSLKGIEVLGRMNLAYFGDKQTAQECFPAGEGTRFHS